MNLGALPMGDAASAAIRLADALPSGKSRAEAVALICGLSLPFLAEDMQKRVMALARKSTVLDDLLAEMVAQGKAEGKAEGQAEGQAKGQAEAILSVLARRFGPVSPDLAERIRGETGLPVLADLLLRAVDAPSLADFARSLSVAP